MLKDSLNPLTTNRIGVYKQWMVQKGSKRTAHVKKTPSKKKRFTVTLDAADYSRLRAIARDHRPPLPLRYVVQYAIVRFLDSGKQVGTELER